MIDFACKPNGVPSLTAALSISPVEICGMLKCWVINLPAFLFRPQGDQAVSVACALLFIDVLARVSIMPHRILNAWLVYNAKTLMLWFKSLLNFKQVLRRIDTTRVRLINQIDLDFEAMFERAQLF